MNTEDICRILVSERDWRVEEMEFCKKVPFLYAKPAFQNQLDRFWRICIPSIYAQWEGFVVSSMKNVVDGINNMQISYDKAPQHLLLLDNKKRFGYLQGNCKLEQQSRFLSDFFEAQRNGINIDRSSISANSNLNYKQLEMILALFEIIPSKKIVENKSNIEKLVWYRNAIAHGEDSICVNKKDVEVFIACITECIDEIILLLVSYINTIAGC